MWQGIDRAQRQIGKAFLLCLLEKCETGKKHAFQNDTKDKLEQRLCNIKGKY